MNLMDIQKRLHPKALDANAPNLRKKLPRCRIVHFVGRSPLFREKNTA